MSIVEGEIERVGTPLKAGHPRDGKSVQMIIVVDDARTADAAIDAFTSNHALVAPNYYIDQSGAIRQFVADARAGNSLALAIYQEHRRNVDRISLSIRLERPATTEYSTAQIDALHRLLAFLSERHQLDARRLATILPSGDGRLRVCNYVPPATSVETGDLLGAGFDPAVELFISLYGESFKPFGGALKFDRAFPIHAAKFNLGAPVSRDEPPPVTIGGRLFNLQAFARDTIFNEGTNYAAVQQLRALTAPNGDEIPIAGLSRALLDASYAASIKAAMTARAGLRGGRGRSIPGR